MGLVKDDIATNTMEKYLNVNAFLCYYVGTVSPHDLYQLPHIFLISNNLLT